MSIIRKVPNLTTKNLLHNCYWGMLSHEVDPNSFFMMQMNIFVVNALTMELPVKVENEYRQIEHSHHLLSMSFCHHCHLRTSHVTRH